VAEEDGVDGRQVGEAHGRRVVDGEEDDAHVPRGAGGREEGVRQEVDAVDVDDGGGGPAVGDGARRADARSGGPGGGLLGLLLGLSGSEVG